MLFRSLATIFSKRFWCGDPNRPKVTKHHSWRFRPEVEELTGKFLNLSRFFS